MIFTPRYIKTSPGSYILPKKVIAKAHPCLNKAVIKEFWNNFSFGYSELLINEDESFVFSVGNASPLPLSGEEYSINVTAGGICICAQDEKTLIHGFMTLLDQIKATDSDETGAEIPSCEIFDSGKIGFRAVHFCVFPETELWELRHFLRFAAALRYTHAVIEFWGTLKYDAMAELSWKKAYNKEQIRPILSEARDLGLEIIPMFNHWGHAAASRARHGKHVVLDQNPALQSYFSEDGWCWNIRKPKVKALLSKIRRELVEICGEGKYFHIGCDEAYNFEFSNENMDFISDFINEINADLATLGRRAIAWGDMFLYKHPEYSTTNRYTCNAPSLEAEEYLLGRLDKSVIIADWQYDALTEPVETAAVFKRGGFDTVICPWDTGRANTRAAISTVKREGLLGFIHTTWHTLSKGMPFVVLTAIAGYQHIEDYGRLAIRIVAAALWRKVMPAAGDYEKAGWSKSQIDFLW